MARIDQPSTQPNYLLPNPALGNTRAFSPLLDVPAQPPDEERDRWYISRIAHSSMDSSY